MKTINLVAVIAVLGLPPFLAAQARPGSRTLFTDVTVKAGITFVHVSGATPDKFMYETFGSGLAWIDYDNDGFPDLFLVNGPPDAPNALYHNNGDGTFTDVTDRAGVAATMPGGRRYKTGAAVGDFDSDGYLDLYLTAYGPNILFRNNGDGTFSDVTAAAGIAGDPLDWSTSAGFFDMDRDGDLDLYVVNYLEYRVDDNPYCGTRQKGYRMYCLPTIFDGRPDRLFRNDGDGKFTDVSREAGIANPSGKGLGVTFCDFDRDADVDIYVANDMVRNFLYRNNGDGTFRDIAYGAGVGFDGNGKPQAGMGVDCGDVVGSDLPDLFVTNFEDELNTLYENRGEGVFEDVSEKAGLGSGVGPLGFGTKMFDYDNDGDLDLHVTNGHVIDNVTLYRPSSSYAQKDLLYENLGGKFRDVSADAGPALRRDRVGRGLAVADYDNDGDLDVAISSIGMRPALLRNEGATAGNWIEMRMVGKASNRFGLGARVTVRTASGVQIREVNNVSSYLSASDIRLHVGVGQQDRVQQIDVLWPAGGQQTLRDERPNQFLIRQARPGDAAGAYYVCLKTGDHGADGEAYYREDPDALGRIYVGPYLAFEPELSLILEDAQGICGYALGASDSRAFYARYEAEWRPGLCARFPEPSGDPGTWTRVQQAYYAYHHPDHFCPEPYEAYPSHVHIDLLPRAQGQGYGRRMLEQLFDTLRARGSPGVHLGLSARNTRAYGFYRRLGFVELTRVGSPEDGAIYMGRTL